MQRCLSTDGNVGFLRERGHGYVRPREILPPVPPANTQNCHRDNNHNDSFGGTLRLRLEDLRLRCCLIVRRSWRSRGSRQLLAAGRLAYRGTTGQAELLPFSQRRTACGANRLWLHRGSNFNLGLRPRWWLRVFCCLSNWGSTRKTEFLSACDERATRSAYGLFRLSRRLRRRSLQIK